MDFIDDDVSQGSLTETSASESASSSDGRPSGERQRIKVLRKKLVLRSNKVRSPVPPVPFQPILFQSHKRHRNFLVFPQFVSLDEIQRLHAACTHESVKQIKDRSAKLTYRHVAYRVELQTRQFTPDLYNRLVEAVRWSDQNIWCKLPERSFPELEYIVYDAQLHAGRPGYIEEHVDNKSAVTFVIMLSHPSDFAGGVNYFARAEKHGVPRAVALRQGDMVVFRGERLLHWISPVPRGRRIIFQGEMSRV